MRRLIQIVLIVLLVAAGFVPQTAAMTCCAHAAVSPTAMAGMHMASEMPAAAMRETAQQRKDDACGISSQCHGNDLFEVTNSSQLPLRCAQIVCVSSQIGAVAEIQIASQVVHAWPLAFLGKYSSMLGRRALARRAVQSECSTLQSASLPLRL